MFKILRRGHNLINFQKQLIHHVKNYHEVRKNVQPLLLKRYYSESTSSTPLESNAENDGPNYEEICKGDKELEHKLKVLELEVEVLRQEGHLVPDNNELKTEHWLELLNNLKTRTARMGYLNFVFKLQKKKQNQKLKKEKNRIDFEVRPKVDKEKLTFEEFVHTYDLSHNNLFLRFHDKTINHFYNTRLIQAMLFGQKIIFDCSYDMNMTKRECITCAKQLMFAFSENRVHDDPYDIYFCNTNLEGNTIHYLQRHIPILLEDWFPMNIKTESYLDLFPKNKLVYLTPHCREELNEYDHDAIYVIGALVDKQNHEPLSLAKAKKEGLKMAKLPLDRYLQWGSGGSKNLTLNHVISIMLDIKKTGDWTYALRHVPRRKVADYEPSPKTQREETRPLRNWTPKSPNFPGLKSIKQVKPRTRIVNLYDE